MLYFSSDVKIEGPKEEWGMGQKKFIAPELGRHQFPFVSTPMIYHVCETVILMY